MAPKIHIIGPRDGHDHTHTVILLHGRDSSCDEFASEFFESEASEPAGQPRTLLDLFPTMRWVFPGAPMLHSQRFDTPFCQWYDMWSVENPNERVNLQMRGLRQSTDLILDIIKVEEKTLPRHKIFLGGISQGFSTAVSAFFAGGNELAGLLGFCSWMPLESLANDLVRDAGVVELEGLYTLYSAGHTSGASAMLIKETPILLTHSVDDDVVPVDNGRKLRKFLDRVPGSKVEWHEYADGGHWINEPLGVDDFVSFIRANMR